MIDRIYSRANRENSKTREVAKPSSAMVALAAANAPDQGPQPRMFVPTGATALRAAMDLILDDDAIPMR